MPVGRDGKERSKGRNGLSWKPWTEFLLSVLCEVVYTPVGPGHPRNAWLGIPAPPSSDGLHQLQGPEAPVAG